MKTEEKLEETVYEHLAELKKINVFMTITCSEQGVYFRDILPSTSKYSDNTRGVLGVEASLVWAMQ